MPSKIKTVEFKPGLPLELEVIPIAVTIANNKVAVSTPHRPEFYSIFWIQKGTAEYVIDFEPVKVQENSFLFLNKNRVQIFDHMNEHDGKILLFTDNFFAKGEEDTKYLHSTILFNDLLKSPVLELAASPPLQTFFSAIETELAQEKDNYQYPILHNLLHSLLLTAERERKNQGFTEMAKGADLDYTVLFKDLLESQFKALKSVSGYAAQINVSEKRLTAAATKTVGKSPKTIIDERVMLEAKRLLIHTTLSIKQIAYELGFEDPAYFVKYFRKHTHKTPIEFRESYFEH